MAKLLTESYSAPKLGGKMEQALVDLNTRVTPEVKEALEIRLAQRKRELGLTRLSLGQVIGELIVPDAAKAAK